MGAVELGTAAYQNARVEIWREDGEIVACFDDGRTEVVEDVRDLLDIDLRDGEVLRDARGH